MFSRREVKVHIWSPASERGAVLAEYGFVLMLVVFAAMLTLTLFGGAVLEMYTSNTDLVSQTVDTALAN